MEGCSSGALVREHRDEFVRTLLFFVTQYGAARVAASTLGFSVGVKPVACALLSEARARSRSSSLVRGLIDPP
jgi:hypothetical protein